MAEKEPCVTWRSFVVVVLPLIIASVVANWALLAWMTADLRADIRELRALILNRSASSAATAQEASSTHRLEPGRTQKPSIDA